MSERTLPEKYPKIALTIAMIVITIGAFIIYAKLNDTFDLGEFTFLLIIYVYPLSLSVIFLMHLFITWVSKKNE